MKTFEEYNKEIRESIIDHWMRDGYTVKNMESDPVINLLLSALAYQAFHIHNKINQYEEHTVREFRDRILPFYLIKPIPAFSIVEAKLKDGANEKLMDETCPFEFTNSKKQKFTFTPLLNTKIVNAELTMRSQLAENTWRVELKSSQPIDNLSGISFLVNTREPIEIESITYQNEKLPLLKPSQYYDLPFTKWFNNAHLFLNQNYYLFGTYDYWQELFLTHNTRLYYIGQYDKKIGENVIELEIAFNSPVESNNLLKINCIPVVNVEKKEVALDERNPVKDLISDTGEFLNLLCDKENEKDYENILVRQYGVERYNSNQLFEQMQEMLYRYHTDYYAFQDIRELKTSDKLESLENIMEEIRSIVGKSEEKIPKSHHYAILKKNNSGAKKADLKYLTTAGAAANGMRKEEKPTKVPIPLDINKTVLLHETKGGRNSIKDETQKEDIAKYYFQTKDRLVTPADIHIFIKTFYYDNCKLNNEIENLAIKRENAFVSITIDLKEDSPLKNSEKTDLLAETLQSKINLKTTGVLPFKVKVS